MTPTHRSLTDGSVAYVVTRNNVVVTFRISEGVPGYDPPVYTLPTPTFDRKYRKETTTCHPPTE
jgi:hypothetical protein